MAVNMQDVSSALAELGRLRFGEMKVEDAMHEIVRSTHAIFDVDGAGPDARGRRPPPAERRGVR